MPQGDAATIAVRRRPPTRTTPFIDGEFRLTSSGGALSKVDPSTGEVIADVLVAGAADVDDAFDAARAAQSSWAARPAGERASLLHQLAEAIRADTAELGRIGTLESGVPTRTSRAMASRSADFLEFYADALGVVSTRTPGTSGGGVVGTLAGVPFGTVGVLPSWNGHSGMWRKCAPALAAGNCVVLKPSELAPFAALRYAELTSRIGLPRGVFSVVPGGPETGQAVAGHQLVDKISFTGGRRAAAAVMSTAGRLTKPVLLELGGKSAAIVFADCDRNRVGRDIALAGLALSGQGCVNPTRLLVQREALAGVVASVLRTTAGLRVGDPYDEATDLGPLISAAARDRVARWIERCRSERWGQIETAAPIHSPERAGAGFFVDPVVITGTDMSSPIAQAEIFGPVLCVAAFDSEHEAIELANATEYGLSGYVFSGDVERARRVAAAVHAGAMSINRVGPVPPQFPFGGMKGSGFGREGGHEGLLEYLQTRLFCEPRPDRSRERDGVADWITAGEPMETR